MKKAKKVIIVIISIIAILLIAAAGWLHFSTYHPSSAAQKVAQTASQTNKVTVFKARHNKMTVIFYTGALVEPDSYSIWAKQVANAGYTVKVVHFPLNLAFFNVNAADKLAGKNKNYVVGGHSLGGAMASRYGHGSHNKYLRGIFLLGAYADEKGRLDKTNLDVLSITASHDKVLNWQKYQTNKKYLPKNTSYQTIKGGNHGNFGSYGQQKGDGHATISNANQQKQVASLLINWLNKVSK
ncbi:alpha/beta hydrolase [Lactobacillus rodentium]|uniref:Carboxymethylenebutenolidase n=1 Tax=Lactobacillus rodentium TaxID=947835 RepID=A0A2Z6TFW3_9LACO|nr:alpha/beta hydrolase [Lactobacillus rodentium]MCR1894594.1 alpha/beta hydrolase [Lactobacillus rodentium]GBG04932.1 carboxymethylenebutenolidase [Lactobacillus rodentium]